MKIVHIVGTPGLGGVQTYLLDLSSYDKKFHISRSLLCLHGNEGDLKDKFLVNGVNCISFSIMPRDYSLRPYRLWKIIRRFFLGYFILKLFFKVKKIKPDIIVCEEPNRLNQQLIVSLFLNIPYIWHIHNENQFFKVNKLFFKLALKYYLDKNLFIMSDSKYILEKNLGQYKNIINDKWDIIPILPAMSDLAPIFNNKVKNSIKSKNQIHIGSIGRLAPVKNYEVLINIFAIVNKKCKKSMRLSIAGVGTMHTRLNRLIKDLKLEENVKLIGNVERENIAEYLYTLDIYVQSSISEGSPLTIKEAMAASLPIISTKVGGVPEMIIDGETGVLVRHGDQEQFVHALIELINMDVTKRERIGENAFNFAIKNYSMELLAKKNVAIYENHCRKSK